MSLDAIFPTLLRRHAGHDVILTSASASDVNNNGLLLLPTFVYVRRRLQLRFNLII
jgi:hypothetical protein